MERVGPAAGRGARARRRPPIGPRPCDLARGLLARLVGGLLPCPGCGRRPAGARGLCSACAQRALRPGTDGPRLWLGAYAGPLGRAVRALKYRGATRSAAWLGRSLAGQVKRAGWTPDVVCPVPLHASRRRQRGYNQAALLSRALATALGTPHREALERLRVTPPQARLSREARSANVAGAFRAAAGADVRGRCVLLVDDVLTTGATLRACAVALRAAGAGTVLAAVVARADRPREAPATRPPAPPAPQNETSSAVPMPTSAPTRT